MRIRTDALAIGVFATVSPVVLALSGAGSTPGYLKPPPAIVEILEAEPIPTVTLSPARDTIAVVARRSMPSIDELARPMLRLAGLRIDPANNGPHRTPSGQGLSLKHLSGATKQIATPEQARIDGVEFSPDGKRLVFTNTRADRIDLYIVDVATGASRRVDAPLNTLAGGCKWLNDSSALLWPATRSNARNLVRHSSNSVRRIPTSRSSAPGACSRIATRRSGSR